MKITDLDQKFKDEISNLYRQYNLSKGYQCGTYNALKKDSKKTQFLFYPQILGLTLGIHLYELGFKTPTL